MLGLKKLGFCHINEICVTYFSFVRFERSDEGYFYPLIGILHLSSIVFSLLSLGSELDVVIAGLVASSLIAMVYVIPWVLLLSVLKKFRPSTK